MLLGIGQLKNGAGKVSTLFIIISIFLTESVAFERVDSHVILKLFFFAVGLSFTFFSVLRKFHFGFVDEVL